MESTQYSEYFPWEDVMASRSRKPGQGQRSVEEGKGKHLKKAVPCPICDTPADRLSWVYLVTPEWTWQTVCGKAGWITVCNRCRLQVDFFVEIMN